MGSSPNAGNLPLLDSDHAGPFKQSLARILSTHVAEFAYSEILDGLPTESSFLEFHIFKRGNPVFELNHTSLCPGVLRRTRDFRDTVDPLSLTFPTAAIHLYNLDDGVHKHSLYEEWRDSHRTKPPRPGEFIAPTPFYHRSYLAHHQYPDGIADIVGYWAEAKIFGGVVIFDRGELGTECRDVFLHPARFKGPRTIYPPTPKQYDALISFLLGPSDGSDCPIPMHPTRENRWRYDPWDSMTRYHIFRDRHEREPNEVDWPELYDEQEILLANFRATQGEPVDQAAIDAAMERMKQITPSSPLWNNGGNSWGNQG
ncbi:hypothetical protein N656DRAFT_834716 [Canariomyces notabilis]|uniref:Uncharacterized protein n=1 Tax=Canariomyces notabilis TaxID=2074819 RepID=A0AAN6TJH2_9PEZI|nr:hypothetical protein N656DRAFT_834716 [Canariomyces arenarius]